MELGNAGSSERTDLPIGLGCRPKFGSEQQQGQILENKNNGQVSSQPNINFFNFENASVSSLAGEIMEGIWVPIQENNLDSVTAYFNSTFEGLEAVVVQLTKGILDPKKHSVVTVKNNPKSSEYPKG